MSENLIHLPSAIFNSQSSSDTPFVDFNTNPPEENLDTRHYFEACVITEGVNRNGFEVLPEAMEMVAVGYKEGRPLSINHDKGSGGLFPTSSTALGYGATVDAAVVDNKLYVASYLALNKTYPNGPFGNSEELRDGIVDGFIGNVSQSILPLKARCSVCELPYPLSRKDHAEDGICKHYVGEPIKIETDGGEQRIEIVHIVIEEADAIELSLVMIPADTESGITKPTINFSFEDHINEQRAKFEYQSTEGVNNPLANPRGDKTVSITIEQLQAAETRAVTAESQISQLNAQVSVLNAKSVTLESEVATSEAQKKTVEAEKATLEAQLQASEAKIVQLEAAAVVWEEEVNKRETKIQELESSAKENEIVIQDGIEARETIVEKYVEGFVAAVGEGCTEEMKARQEEVAKSLSITILEDKILGFQEAAKQNFPEGKSVEKPETEDQDNDKDDENDDDTYPIGV